MGKFGMRDPVAYVIAFERQSSLFLRLARMIEQQALPVRMIDAFTSVIEMHWGRFDTHEAPPGPAAST